MSHQGTKPPSDADDVVVGSPRPMPTAARCDTPAPLTRSGQRNSAQASAPSTASDDSVAFFHARLAEAPWRFVLSQIDEPSAARDAIRERARTHSHRARPTRSADTGTSLRVEELGVALAY